MENQFTRQFAFLLRKVGRSNIPDALSEVDKDVSFENSLGVLVLRGRF